MIIFSPHSYQFIPLFSFFFFNDTATTEIYTLSLHDALPISDGQRDSAQDGDVDVADAVVLVDIVQLDEIHVLGLWRAGRPAFIAIRSEEHTSELQSRQYLVCRLLLEKKKNT